MLHSVTWVCLCIPGHIHCSCSTVMGLLCIPLSELVSIAFSTIPICPFLFTCIHVTAIHKMNRDGYRDQIVTHDVGVSLHSKTHPLFMKYSNGTSTVLCISLSELVSCAFSTIPICPFLIPGIFHLLVEGHF